MVLPVFTHHPHFQDDLAIQVSRELLLTDARRFRRLTTRVLLRGFVELDGDVSSYYLKSLAIEVARRVSGVAGVVDMIRVSPASQRMLPVVAK